MSQVIIFAEKPDVGTRLAATLGGCVIDGVEIKPEMLNNKKYEGMIKRERATRGYLECKLNGKPCVITWGYGHIAELKQAADYDSRYKRWAEELFPFIPAKYEIKLKNDSNITKHYALIKKLFNAPETEYIINATDADREGELIFQYVYELTGSRKPYKRLWIASYTEEAILEGFRNLKEAQDVQPLAAAGRCRAIADWLVGANLTAVATLRFGGFQNMISIGRVQTPTLAMLVKRELEIREFKPEPYFELVAVFSTEKGEKYRGKWKKGKQDRFVSKADAEEILRKVQNHDGTVVKYEQETSEEKPPLLYDLTALQMDANAKYGFSAQKTLAIAQKLYENQYLTYPRTNSRYLSEDLKGEIPRILKALPSEYSHLSKEVLGKPLVFSKRFFDSSKVESHHAIIPTYKTPTGLDADDEKIYDLVARSLIKAFMPNAVWGQTKIETEVNGEVFYSAGKVLNEPGWRLAEVKSKGIKKEKEDEDGEEILPLLSKGQRVKAEDFTVASKQTKAPPRFTEKTLLAAMETAGKLVEDEELREAMKDHGLGTPATRAAIIERLIKVGYVKREGKNLIPTEKGVEVIKQFPVEEVKSPALTGEWEFKLNQIERGKLESKKFLQDITAFTVRTTSALKGFQKKEIINTANALGRCPHCGAPVVKNAKGWGCSSWREGCKFQIWDNERCGKRLSPANVKQLLEKGETNLIHGFVSKNGKKFDAKLELVKDGNGKLSFKF